mmetsp:Transcript_168266/g.540597  ORF Transcript_168266/g.540597 Transcript_168266/m.540597 type:complete len:280 (+) Transcript_168266:676-1515(+)
MLLHLPAILLRQRWWLRQGLHASTKRVQRSVDSHQFTGVGPLHRWSECVPTLVSGEIDKMDLRLAHEAAATPGARCRPLDGQCQHGVRPRGLLVEGRRSEGDVRETIQEVFIASLRAVNDGLGQALHVDIASLLLPDPQRIRASCRSEQIVASLAVDLHIADGDDCLRVSSGGQFLEEVLHDPGHDAPLMVRCQGRRAGRRPLVEGGLHEPRPEHGEGLARTRHAVREERRVITVQCLLHRRCHCMPHILLAGHHVEHFVVRAFDNLGPLRLLMRLSVR